jgi:hypothetical protein
VLAIWIADAHRDGGKRFIVHADEKLTAFLELESVFWAHGEAFMLSNSALDAGLWVKFFRQP